MIEFDNRPYWRPRDVAELTGLSKSQVYRMVDSGELEHVRIGARAVRIKSAAVAAMLGIPAPPSEPEANEHPVDLAGRASAFTERTGRTPEEFADAWRRQKIDDTPQNAADAIEALALREALTGAALAV